MKINEGWKTEDGFYKCPECGKKYVRKGIITHYYRAHTDKKFSSGTHGHYKDKDYINKRKMTQSKYFENKLGELKKFTVSCYKCNKEFDIEEREYQYPKKQKYFCSLSCANSHNKSIETRLKISQKLKGREVKDRTIIQCKYCGQNIRIIKGTKRMFCNNNCRTSFSQQHIDKEGLKYYRAQCQFNFNLADYFDEFDFRLISEHGWYKAKNYGDNLGGVSRDHMVSIKYGFEHNIDYKIIAHPANCKLMLHNMNSAKCSKCSITIEQLLERIKVWDEKYKLF